MYLKQWIDRNLKGDPVIWAILLLCSLFSILTVYSATSSLAYKKAGGNTEVYLIKHTLLVILAIVCAWLAHKVNYKYYSRLSRLALIISVPLLLYTFFFGSNINQATRGFIIPVINLSFQTSDFAKLALIANLASMLARRQHSISDFKKSLMPMLIWCGLICGLIALSNFSTSFILFCTCVLLMFIGRVPVKQIFYLFVIGTIFVTLALAAGQRLSTSINRVNNFLNSKNIPYQAEQSFIAIWRGGYLGVGPGNSVQKNFIPHSYSDFIYSIIIEEYGFVGGVFILFLYLALLYRALKGVAHSDKAFGGLLSAGLGFSIVIQALIHMGVAVGLGPITGQPLPLISMGGTSLLFTGISIGIILSVSRGDNTNETEADLQPDDDNG
ncbi:MAG: FtsW/RodA/SpoVE family cell cycle protein [Cytophagaceae bacterium]|nr:FtsW/RodA/SpoVE family cell cycle protein [Cytophagaceae bacterium]MDW8455419.1 FtsW/RodA/SpoVE family cell cycle protein [Cytophagaceae bacterium]